MNNSKIAAAILGGIAAGIGLGILFAPEKGQATRNKLLRSFKSREEELKARAARRTQNIKKAEKKSAGISKSRAHTVNEVQQEPVRTVAKKSSGSSGNSSNSADSN